MDVENIHIVIATNTIQETVCGKNKLLIAKANVSHQQLSANSGQKTAAESSCCSEVTVTVLTTGDLVPFSLHTFLVLCYTLPSY